MQPNVTADSAPAAPASAPARAPGKSLSTPSLAELPPDDDDPDDDDRGKPSSGLGMIIPGWILAGNGALNLALLPVCHADFYPTDAAELCVGLSIAFGAVGLSVGIPLLVAGYNQRAKHKDWERRHPALSHLLRTRLAAQRDAALVVYHGAF